MKIDIELPNLNKKKRKRLLFLVNNLLSIHLPKINDWKSEDYGEENVSMLKEIHNLFDITNFSEEEKEKFYRTYKWDRRKEHVNYDAKPIKEKKDNKDFYNGNGGSNKNKVRYPKKCRKTAWKRFAKLFPHLVKVKKGKIIKK